MENKDLDSLSIAEKNRYLKILKKIAHQEHEEQQKILGSHRPLEGLTMRAFLRWIRAHCLLLSDDYVDRLLKEILWNPDSKLTKKLITTSKLFPKKRVLESKMLAFIKSDNNIFPHQEAECLRAIRYLSNLHQETIDHAKARLEDQNAPPYLRMQAAYLLSRIELDRTYIRKIESLINEEQHPHVQVALSMLLVQKRKGNSEVVRHLVFHPNEKLREVGKLYQYIKNDEKMAKNRLKHIFRLESPWLVCDNMPFLHLMSMSSSLKVRQCLVDAIRSPRLTCQIVGVRKIFKNIFTRTRKSIQAGNDA